MVSRFNADMRTPSGGVVPCVVEVVGQTLRVSVDNGDVMEYPSSGDVEFDDKTGELACPNGLGGEYRFVKCLALGGVDARRPR